MMDGTFDDLINTQIENSEIKELKENITKIKKIHNIEDKPTMNNNSIDNNDPHNNEKQLETESDDDELSEEDIVIMKQNLYCYLNFVEEIKQKKEIINDLNTDIKKATKSKKGLEKTILPFMRKKKVHQLNIKPKNKSVKVDCTSKLETITVKYIYAHMDEYFGTDILNDFKEFIEGKRHRQKNYKLKLIEHKVVESEYDE